MLEDVDDEVERALKGGVAVAVPTGTWKAHMRLVYSRGTSGPHATTPAQRATRRPPQSGPQLNSSLRPCGNIFMSPAVSDG